MQAITCPPRVQRILLLLSLATLLGLAGTGSGPASPSLDLTVTPATGVDQNLGSISVFVFLDRVERGGCDTFFKRGADLPVSGVRILFTGPGRRQMEQWTDTNGYLYFPGIDLMPGQEIFIEAIFPSQFRGWGLEPCPNSPTVRRITQTDFRSLRSLHIAFRARPLPATSAPTATPTVVPSETPVPTVMPEPTSLPTQTSTATTRPTDTPIPVPTHTPTPVATFTATATAVTTDTPQPTTPSTPTEVPLTPEPTPCQADIMGLVWHDVNGNGRREEGERPLAQAIVTLWAGDVALQTWVTGNDGQYRFVGLAPGVYSVTETDPPEYRSTTPSTVEFQAGCGVTRLDFGDRLQVECPRGIGGIVWNDVNGDGIIQFGEPPLADSRLTLLDSGGKLVSQYQTKNDGIYRFEGLAADVYTLIETNPADYPESTTVDNWVVDLVVCRVVAIHFGDRRSSSEK